MVSKANASRVPRLSRPAPPLLDATTFRSFVAALRDRNRSVLPTDVGMTAKISNLDVFMILLTRRDANPFH